MKTDILIYQYATIYNNKGQWKMHCDTTRKSVRYTSKADLKQEGKKKNHNKIVLYGVYYCLGFSNE